MKFYVLASLIIFSLVISRAVKRNSRMHQKSEETFWERERRSNSVRRKSLEHLNYIQVPLEHLPVDTMKEDEKIAEYLEILRILAAQPIVNLTGYTNTDLKLEYGTANITLLMEYDQNYTLLARTLQQWADVLYAHGYIGEARRIMEYAIQTETDVGNTYYLLAEIYSKGGEENLIAGLIAGAKALHSPHKVTIVRKLQESYPSAG